MVRPTKPAGSARSRVRRPRGRVDAGREFTVIVERDADDWYVATVPELRGCHTQARSLDVLTARIREAIKLCLEIDRDAGGTRFVGLQRVSVER